MKKFVPLFMAFTLAACGGHPGRLPPDPSLTDKVEVKVPVAVLCEVEIDRAKVKLDEMEQGRPLEEQDAAFRETIAQLKAYIIQLEAGITGCGGKINK
jgi:hypothetical protein